MAHDHKRHGITTLFAALNAHDGTVIADCKTRYRHKEWLAFPRKIDREIPKDKVLQLICDNYATHKPPRVKIWLKKPLRFHMHLTPMSGSWPNMVERVFAALPSIVCAARCSRVSLGSPKHRLGILLGGTATAGPTKKDVSSMISGLKAAMQKSHASKPNGGGGHHPANVGQLTVRSSQDIRDSVSRRPSDD